MKKITTLTTLLFSLCISISLFAQEASTTSATPTEVKKKDDPFFTASVGLGLRDTTWKHIESADNTTMDFKIKKTTYSILEGDLSIPKWAAKLGFNAYQDLNNDIGKVKQFAGYLGFSRMTLKTESGKFAGHAHFSGQITSEQSRDVDFDQKFTYYQIDVWPSEDFPMYVGLRHTTWKLPTEIALLHMNQNSGPTVFDEDFETSFYSLLFGVDTFKYFAMKNEESSNGWGVMALFEIGMGYGKSKIGQKAQNAAYQIYGKRMTESNPSVMALNSAGQLGPSYKFSLGPAKLSLGVGYDWNLLMVINLSKKATTSTETSPVAYPNFVYHGPIVRLYGTF